MKRPLAGVTIPILVCLCFGVSWPATDEPAYPATEPGRHARDYFAAYNADEPAMRVFFGSHVSAGDLKTRSAEQRLQVWHQMRERLGHLTPIRVLDSADDALTVLARNEHGGEIAMHFHCTPDAPHTLVAIQVEDLAGADEGSGGPAVDTGPPLADPEIVAALSSELDSLAHAGAFSGAVELDKDGKPLFTKAYGMADRATGRANTADTRFNLGSINKIFTTVAIQQLDQQGRLRLDDPIVRYLPDYPAESAKKITIRMLLEHRAGVPDVLRSPALWKNPLAVRTAEDWYRLIRDEPLEFEPGTRQRYSNGGFVMLGMIVQRVSGADYYAYVRDHVYSPAGMTRTDSYQGDHLPADVAVRYTRDTDSTVAGGADPHPESIHLGRGSAAGGGYSTVGDLVRFAGALRAHRLLDAAHTDAVIGPGVSLGIAGGSPGVNALVELSGPYTLVALANADPPAAEQLAKTAGRRMRRATSTAGPSGGATR
jgi:CubicO group peptidase (beta-lactamase class C family)